jgi:hypothetical protein
MSWLFCCSNSQQSTKEHHGTMDLSKPINPANRVNTENPYDIDGLSGRPNE